MIRSMTGFGRSEAQTKFGILGAEIRTLNHKFLEVTFKLSNSLSVFDDRVKELIKRKIKRGKVYLNLIHETNQDALGNILINEKLARDYYNKLHRLKDRLSIDGPIRLNEIISFPGVVNQKLTSNNITKLWPYVKKVIEEALDKLVKDREGEGGYLFKDLTKRIKKIKKIVNTIKENSTYNVRNYKRKLSERIKELSSNYPIDKGRLEVEVALYAKNSDISEELTRLSNHIANFNKTMGKSGEVGKKLDFISQELHREINTIGAKANDYSISDGVIEIKTEIEKIREQLKNIE